jgi:DNA polymerase-3 subunit delta
VYYLFGDDDYLKDGAIHDLLNSAIDASTRDFNCEIRRGSELDPETLGSLLATPPMLAERRAVVIRDVTLLKKAARQQLDQYLKRPASDTLLLLVSPAGTKADASLSSLATALDFESLSPERVRKWIAHHAASVLDIGVTEEATQLLQQSVGNDLHLLAAELDKCASYVQGAHAVADAATVLATTSGTVPVDVPKVAASSASVAPQPAAKAVIDADAVAAIVGVRRGETVTDLLDAVAAQDAARAIALVNFVLGQPKVSGVQVVMMLSTQAFALSFGRARRDAGTPTNRLPSEFFAFLKETGGYPGRPWGEAASAWTKVVDKWSADACARSLVLLLEADIALKESTVSTVEQVISSLVLALCALRPKTRRAA